MQLLLSAFTSFLCDAVLFSKPKKKKENKSVYAFFKKTVSVSDIKLY